MIRVHLVDRLPGSPPSVEFPTCNGWYISPSGLLEAKKDGEVMAAFQRDVWEWVEDVQDAAGA